MADGPRLSGHLVTCPTWNDARRTADLSGCTKQGLWLLPCHWRGTPVLVTARERAAISRGGPAVKTDQPAGA